MKKIKNLFKTKHGKIIALILGVIIVYFIAAGSERTKAINAIIAKMKADSGWLSTIQAKATKAGISLQQQLKLDATWMLKRMDEYKNKWWNF